MDWDAAPADFGGGYDGAGKQHRDPRIPENRRWKNMSDEPFYFNDRKAYEDTNLSV